MQLHAAIGGNCIREIESRLGKSNFLTMAREIAFNHHERWDGRGYPKGLSGDDIPLAARIVAIANVYDALSAKRVYREALPHEKCVEMIRGQAGRQFDPALVEIFLKVEAEFRDIARQNCGGASESRDVRLAPQRKRRSPPRRPRPSLESEFAMLHAAIDLCADNPPSATASLRKELQPSAQSTDTPASTDASVPPSRKIESKPSSMEQKEPEYVA